MTEARQKVKCFYEAEFLLTQSFIDFACGIKDYQKGQYYFRKTNIWASMTEARQKVKCFMILNSCKQNLLFHFVCGIKD